MAKIRQPKEEGRIESANFVSMPETTKLKK
jgi:hypothetical protein